MKFNYFLKLINIYEIQELNINPTIGLIKIELCFFAKYIYFYNHICV